MSSSVILLEFNELCPPLMRRFMREGKLPNFQRLHDESEVFTTDAGEDPPYLEPWIQWVTVHSGLSYKEHQVFHLSDGPELREKCIWDTLSEHGRRVWICGSMNVRYDQSVNGLVLPDPWATGIAPSDPRLVPYFEFVKHNVLEHSNDDASLSGLDYLRFVSFMATHGLSLESVSAIATQLLSERRGHDRWKRATILDKLQFDVFAHYYRKLKPNFSSFFLNSTAHFQHLFWRNLEPHLFPMQPTSSEQEEYASAILYGYQEMDRLIARFYDLADDDTTLIFCTALSQQPCPKYDMDGGKSFYRPKDFKRFLDFTGIEGFMEVVPVMSENFIIRFRSVEAAAVAKERLDRLRVGESAALTIEQRANSLYTGCSVIKRLPNDSVLLMDSNGRSASFFDYFYQVEGMKSGMHHPDGMLWIRQQQRNHHVHEKKMQLTAVAPMILDLLSVPKSAQPQPNSTHSAATLASVVS